MNTITVFTDGSSRGNPGPGGWGAVAAFGGTVREFGGREAHTTNNRMELKAAYEALKFVSTLAVGDVSRAARDAKSCWGEVGTGQLLFASRAAPITILVHTDSSYLTNGITKWVKGWQKSGWITSQKEPVLNTDLWKKLIEVTSELETCAEISWLHIKGHAGIPGNERCDEIATAYADGNSVELYSGPLGGYKIDLASVVHGKIKKEISLEKKERAKQKAYSYLSMVNGEIKKHGTWAECERRVKGVKNTKFKKAVSAEDEESIIRDWTSS